MFFLFSGSKKHLDKRLIVEKKSLLLQTLRYTKQTDLTVAAASLAKLSLLLQVKFQTPRTFEILCAHVRDHFNFVNFCHCHQINHMK